MTRLLSPDVVAAFEHFFKNVTVADGGFDRFYSVFVTEFPESYVAHNGYNGSVVFKGVITLHFGRYYGYKLITVDLVAVAVYCKAAVGVAVKSKAHVAAVGYHKFAERRKMGGAAIVIYIYSVGLSVYNKTLGTEL